VKTNLATTETTSARGHSPLSAQQWRTLETFSSVAIFALHDLRSALLFAARDSSDAELQAKLFEQIERLKDAECRILPAYFYHVQPEWTGGDSLDPKNTVLREPALMQMRRLTVRE